MSIPVIKVAYTVKEPYTTTETYYEKEPYETTETYYEKEPYETTETYYLTEPHTEIVPLSYIITDWVFGGYIDSSDQKVTIKNVDNTGGSFWVTFHSVSTDGTYDYTTYSAFLMPSESNNFKHTFPGRYIHEDSSYNIHTSTKEVTKYRKVQKERAIIKYREVPKERTVIKYCDVAKQRTVTKYGDVTKYKYISAYEYLMQE